MTLTPNREEFEQWAELACELPWGFLAKRRKDSGEYADSSYEYMWQAWVAGRELLANRDTQPVMWAHERKLSTDVAITKDEVVAAAWKNEGLSVTPLYTAPPVPAPAPANSVAWEMRYWNNGYYTWGEWERITAEQHAEMSVQHASDNDYEFRVLYDSPPAPAVPDEATAENVEALSGYVSTYKMTESERDISAEVWNACRAAMLAQPVSSGYKLNSPVIPDGWIACSEQMPELDKRVLLYFGSYDGHIEDGCIGDDGDGAYHYFFDGDSLQQEPTHWMPLPAAPEASHDNS